MKELKDKKLPLPPISIQEEIVAEIEGYQKIIDGAKAVVAHYKPKIDINPDWEMVELGEVCEKFQYGSSKKSLSSGEVVCLRMGNIQNGEIEWSDLKFAPRDEDFEKYLLEPGDVLFNRTNSPVHVGKTGIYRGERKSVFAGYLIRLKYRKDVILGDYLNYCLNTNKAKEFCQRVKTDGINQSNINAKVLATFQIPLPKIETQRQIVAQIEKEQALVNANKQLIEIFEQKIKDRIAKVWGVEKTEEATLSRAAEPATEYLKN
jgi:type I restriction enzyme S subunit